MDTFPICATFQEDRLKTFKFWPYKKGPCRPEKMAEAGFYAVGQDSEPDLAKCYVCFKELDGWERDDDPWSEHRKHAPQCPFVVLNKTPMELTYKDIFTLEVEGVKRFLVLHHENKMKIFEKAVEDTLAELDMTKGKENQKQKSSRATTKRSSRKN